MMLVLDTIGPVAAIVALGYVLGGRRGLHLPTLADLAILVTSPALMFSVLSGTTLEPRQWWNLAGGTLWIAAGTALLAWIYMRCSRVGARGLLLPAVFWNAGNIALPCARLAFGPEGSVESAARFTALHQRSMGLFTVVGLAVLALIVLHSRADAAAISSQG